MAYVLEKNSNSRCALDAASTEAFTQKQFSDLIYDAHSKGQDYFIARVHCVETEQQKNSKSCSYFCYDARQLCKFIFEMVISAEGRKIRIKNFKDPINFKEISEINFFKLRYDTETPLRAEFIGNHINFLESNVFRSKLFYQEDALDALSVNFQFKNVDKLPYIKKKKFIDVFMLIVLLLVLGILVYIGIRAGKAQLAKSNINLKKELGIPSIKH